MAAEGPSIWTNNPIQLRSVATQLGVNVPTAPQNNHLF